MIIVPPGFVRNHPSQTRKMDPNDAGEYLLNKAAEAAGVSLPEIRVLDVGCGTRFATAIVNKEIKIGGYFGVDVHRGLIEWLRRATQGRYDMQFAYWHVRNERSNPDAPPITFDTELPFDVMFDLITLFSVFTHLPPADAQAMLGILRRHLKPRGKIFMTCFVKSDQEAPYTDAVPGKPLLKCIYRTDVMESMIEGAGLRILGRWEPELLTANQYLLSL